MCNNPCQICGDSDDCAISLHDIYVQFSNILGKNHGSR